LPIRKTITSTRDLAAPLSQVLSDGTANYVYGHDRLRAQGGPWYVGDALGSVRQTLDDAGAVLATTSGACPEQREGTRGARRRAP
jgi:hypothetical protein